MAVDSFSVRRYSDADRAGLVGMLDSHMRIDESWPPGYAREKGEVLDWLAGRSHLGRWIAREEARIVGHLSADRVEPGEKADVWEMEIGCGIERLAEIGRLVVLPEVRRSGVSGALTRHGVRDIVEQGYVPVASAFHDAVASRSMMTNLGWKIIGSVQGRRSGRAIHLLIAPQRLVEAALSHPLR